VLRCTDRAGHALAEVHVRTARDHEAMSETASFCFAVEPAAIDAFVSSLAAMPMVVGADTELAPAS